MTILLFGAGFNNKGAQLMLMTTIKLLREQYPEVRLCVSSARADRKQAAQYGLERTREYLLHTGAGQRRFYFSWRYPVLYNFLRKLMGKSAEPGTVSWKEVDAVLDISGLAYSEKWGTNPIINLDVLTRKCAADKKKYILMPQAFGPFDEHLEEVMARALGNVTVAFARDSSSYATLSGLAGTAAKNIRQCPDITHLLPADEISTPPLPTEEEGYFIVVPNARMLDKAGEEWKARYLDFLLEGMEAVLNKSAMHLMIMVHSTTSGQDNKLASTLYDRLLPAYGKRITLFSHEDPMVLKKVLQQANFLIGSRFHALVSALSSGTPSIGTSWQHKYRHLFEEYGIDKYLVLAPDVKLSEVAGDFLSPSGRSEIENVVRGKREEIKNRVKVALSEAWSALDTLAT